jgi:hypothetical protein
MKNRKIRCKNCGNYFHPDNYNRHHQKFCSRDECKKASHRASSREYRKIKSEKAEFRRRESERVKLWQSKNPDYWKRSQKNAKKVKETKLLRDFAQVEKLTGDISVLRDFANLQYFVIEGLIVTLTGDVLRDNIKGFVRQMYNKGREVSGKVSEKDFIMPLIKKRTDNDEQEVNRSSP